ncbi:MAG: NADH dehydrogenase subunit D, partial [Ornithinimicrobium sp.]
VTGLRMNHAYVRPGGVSQDVSAGALDMLEDELVDLKRGMREVEGLLLQNPVLRARTVDVGHLSLSGCMALGITGPILRSTGLPHDLRKSAPYCGYETYDFEVITRDSMDAYGRLCIRIDEMWESIKISEQAIARLRASEGQPVMVADKKIAWPAQLSVGADGQGNSLDHIRKIMGESMESLIHHFKLVTEGFRVPPGQAYAAVESPKGELAVHAVSDGGTRPFRAHFRDPSFNNLQAASVLSEGGLVADVIVAVASIDPVMGGSDR